MSRRDKNKKKVSVGKKIAIGIILFLVIAVAGGYFYVHNLLGKVDQVKIESTPEELGIEPELEKKHGEIKNIALFGIDAPDGEVGRSDAIMILTLDSTHNKIKLTSIMRDSYVDIDGRGMDKINHAYAFGGPELSIKTINKNFNLNIKDFMAVNFTSLPNIIDKIGGVEINITDEEVSHVSGISSPGKYNLTGTQALAYSRIRYATGGDYKRTERQRVVIEGIFNKLKNTQVSNYPSFISEFLPYVKTNMSSMELLKLGTDFAGLVSGGINQERFPRDGQGEGQMINGVYYLTFDIENVKNSMYEYIFNDK
ncbi:LCP family protein [Clostridium carnis]